MKAVTYDRYGGADVLRLAEMPRPVPKPGQVLVRIHAASVNSWDWDLLVGQWMNLPLQGFGRPKRMPILGGDIAGMVEAVGAGAVRFKPGDAVFGDVSNSGRGGFAEYAAVDEATLALKPAGMSFEDAAAIPHAGTLALQALRKRPLTVGQSVLINGAGGGVGSFAIQIARAAGGVVTAVDHGSKLDFMRSLGAEHVIDYTREDFTRGGRRYDRILEITGKRTLAAYLRALAPGGAMVMIGGTAGPMLQTAAGGALLPLFGGKRAGMLLWKPTAADLEELKALCAAGTVRPVIDAVYPLERTADAMRHLGEGRAKGKVVVSVSD